MKGFVEDIWIFTKTGIPMFYLHGDRKEDADKLSSFMSVISICLDSMSASQHYIFETSGKKLSLKKCHENQVIVGILTKKSVKEKHIMTQLDILCDLINGFFSGKDFLKFNGDVADFNDLEIEIMALKNIQLVQPVLN